MLKTPVVEQVSPVVPAQKVLSDSNVTKSHITFNVQNNSDKSRIDSKNKKGREGSVRNAENSKNKSKTASAKEFKNKSKTSSTKEFKSLPSKSSKSSSSKTSKATMKDSQRQRSLLDTSKISSKNECNSDYKKSDGKSNKSKVKLREKTNKSLPENVQQSGKLVSLDLELIESSPSPEPPPPPIISGPQDSSHNERKEELDFDEVSEEEKESKNEITGFKDIKGVSKGRNYVRRNREQYSSSPPSKEVTGDVDFRNGGPAEKQPRLLFDEEKSNIIESKKLISGIYCYLIYFIRASI